MSLYQKYIQSKVRMYQQKSKYISSSEQNYSLHFAMRYPVVLFLAKRARTE